MTRYAIVLYWSAEDNAFIAEVPELPECRAQGQTYQEAVSNVEVIVQEWLEAAAALGRPIPEPEGRPVARERGIMAAPDGSQRSGRLSALLRMKNCCSRFRCPRSFALLTGYVIALGSIEVLTIGLSLAEIRITQLVAIGVLLASMAVAGLCMRFLDPAGPETTFEIRLPSRIHLAVGLIALTAAALYVYLLIVAWVKADYSFDGNLYHIPPMHFWAREGYVNWIRSVPEPNWSRMLHAYMNGYPKGAELIDFVLVQACGFTQPVNALSMVFMPMGVLSIICLTRWFGVSRPLALLAGCLYVFVPVNMHQAFTTCVDVAFGSAVLALAALLCSSSAALWRGAVPWGMLPALGCAMGLVMGIKGTGPIAAALAGGLLFATLVLHVAARSSTRLRHLWRGAAFLVLAGGLATVVGGYWFVRNTVFGGSPIYPLGVFVGDRVLFPGGTLNQIVTAIGQTPQEMRPWPGWRKVLYVWCQGADIKNWLNCLLERDTRRGGFGFLWIAACVPAIVWLLIRGMIRRLPGHRTPAAPDITPGLFLPLCLFMAGFFLATPNNWWARYTLWVYGLGLPAFAWAMQQTFKLRLRWLAVRMGLWLCVLLLLAEAALAVTAASRHPPPYWQVRPGTPFWRPSPDVPYCQMLEDQQAAVALYQLSTWEQTVLGTLCTPIGVRPVFFLDETTANNPERLVSFLRDHEIKYVLCGPAGPVPNVLKGLAYRRDEMRLWRIQVFQINTAQ